MVQSVSGASIDTNYGQRHYTSFDSKLSIFNCADGYKELRAMVEAKGVRIERLPPYSPDLNPIEQSFAELKAWYKRNQQLASDCGSFEEYLKLGLERAHRNPGSHFRSAHVANFYC